MPWKITKPMNQRTEFAIKAMQTENFRDLCREYGISTKTGYKWKQRMLENGVNGLLEKSRRPKSSPDQLSEGEVCKIIKLKTAHPFWGGKKIRELYRRKHQSNISESTVKRILKSAGFVKERKKTKAIDAGYLRSGVKAEEANDVWTVDFKGWWYDKDNLRFEPLTVRDEKSRFILLAKRLPNSCGETVRQCFEELFKIYGLPKTIRSDNGIPFAHTQALFGLSRLSAWWVALGINLERSRPAHPQDNGAHERMHRDISIELQSLHCDQDAMDIWRHTFNYERPHESLGMRFPAEVYNHSKRTYTGTPDDLIYQDMIPRRVQSRGTIKWENQIIFISSSLAGWSVGLKQNKGACLELWFANLLLGFIDPETSSFKKADKTQT